MPFFARRKTEAARLSDLDRCRSEEEVLSVIPPLVQALIGAAQKESIRFYRRVHSHDMGSYRTVRDEFLFVLLSIIRWRIEGLLAHGETVRPLAQLQAELSEACAGLDKFFDRERFWSAWEDRCNEYRAVLPRGCQAAPDLAAEAIVPFFGRHLIDCLDEHGAKVMHFSAHSLRDILRAM